MRKTFLVHKTDQKGLLSFQKDKQLSLGIHRGLVLGPATDSANWGQCSIVMNLLKKNPHIIVDPCNSNPGCSRANCVYVSKRGECTYT